MSIEIMSRVWANSEARGTARLVLLAIADHANPSGIAWPSLRRLSQYANVDKSNVSRAIKSLVEMGELERIGYTKPFNGATKYKVKVVRGGTSAESQPSAEVHLGDSAETHHEVVRRRTTNRNRTKYTQPSIDIDHFKEFWNQYPRKVNKVNAEKAYLKATQKFTHQEILHGLMKYTFNPDRQMIPHASTWLKGERWNDEPTDYATRTNETQNPISEAYKNIISRRETVS